MTTVPRMCPHCRISSRKTAYKALRNSCSQVSAKQQQIKADKIARWKLHGKMTVLLLHACLFSKQNESRWSGEQTPAQDCGSWTTFQARWERMDPSTSFFLERTLCSPPLKVFKGLRRMGPLHAPQGRFLFYGWETKAWGGQLTPDSNILVPTECNSLFQHSKFWKVNQEGIKLNI